MKSRSVRTDDPLFDTSMDRFLSVSASREIALLSAPEFGAHVSERSVLVLPLGAIEQHGPHLPLATDLIIAEEVARTGVQLAVERGVDAWLLPSMGYTKSNEHAWCAGTFWMSSNTMQSMIHDIGTSLFSTKCRKIVFLNGHGGNSALVAMMNRELRLKFGLLAFLTHPSIPADQGGSSSGGELGMGIHAGHDETSLMLYLRPELVQMDRARRTIPEWMAENRHVRFGGPVQFGWLSNDFDESGVIGDPEGANAEHGERSFRSAVEAFSSALQEVNGYAIRGG